MRENIVKKLKNLIHPAGIIGLIISIAIPFLVYLGPNIGHKNTIRNLDLNLPLPLFCIQFIAIIALFCFLSKDFKEWIKTILPQKSFGILTVVFAVTISIFALTQIEARHRVQSDESIFMSVAQNMYYNHESGTCNQGYFKDGGLNCVAKSNSFKTKGLSFLYYLGMPLFGSELHWIFNAELLLLPLSFLLMFLAIVAWTKQPLLAFFASLLMALQPTILFQFRSMSVEPLYIFLSALSLLTFKWAYDKNTLKHWILFALILAFFAQTRQETVFCLLSFILFSFNRILDKKDFKAPSFFLTLSIFTVPVLLTISAFQGFGFQGGEFEAHGHFFEDLAKNWTEMTRPLNKNGELINPFLTYFNYLFLIGLIYLIFRAVYDAKKGDKFYLWTLIFLALYHIQTFIILENVSGDFSIQINQRYSLVMLPTMAFLGALPIAHAIQFFSESIDKNKVEKISFIALIIVSLAFTFWTMHYKKDFNDNIMYNKNHLTIEEYEILNWLKDEPKKERLFIYGRPWHFIGYGISSIHYDKARKMKTDELNQLINDYDGEVFYIRGLDCWDSETYHAKAVEHRISSTCDIFEREMEMVGVKNILITNNYWVQIAKFNGRKTYNPKNIISINELDFNKASPQEKLNLNELEENTDVNKIIIDTLRYKYELKETNKAIDNWELLVLLNNKVMSQNKYITGSYEFVIASDTLIPGFNQIRFIVQDVSKKTSIVDVSKYYFNVDNGVIPLSSLKYENHTQGWGNIHFNESIEGNPLTVDTQKFENGFGTHSPSTTTYNIEGKYSSFRTSVGLDDESLCGNGVHIEIYGDDKLLSKSTVIQNGTLLNLSANTKGVQKLTLKSIPKEGMDCTHVDFINSVLIP